jgi:hypothetical protein
MFCPLGPLSKSPAPEHLPIPGSAPAQPQSPGCPRCSRALLRGGAKGLWLSLALLAGLSPTVLGLTPQDSEVVPTPEAVATELEQKINAALRKGVEFLLEDQCFDGSFEGLRPEYPSGTTSLVALALLKCGLPPDHPSIQRAFEFMRVRPQEQTYTASLAIMVYRAVGGKQHLPEIEELTRHLLDWQRPQGWGYPGEVRDGRLVGESGDPDFSNLHFALFALKAAEEAGVSLPKQLWPGLANAILGYLGPEESLLFDGKKRRYTRGILYRRNEKVPRSAMTAAGAAMLRVCINNGALPARLARQAEDGIELIKAWLDANFRYDTNVGSGLFPYYNLMALERAASLNGWEEIGGRPWYEAGATYLLEQQNGAGYWESGDKASSLGGRASDTAMALLFLKRASRPTTGGDSIAPASDQVTLAGPDEPISLRIAARSPLVCTLTDFATSLRQKADAGPAGGLRVLRVEWYLDDVLAATLPGDPSQPWIGERFGAGLDLPTRGWHRVRARAQIVAPDAPAEAHEPTEWIESKTIDVHVLAVLEPWMLKATQYGLADRLAQERGEGLRIQAVASSVNSEDHPDRLVDGLPNTLWLAQRGEEEPHFSLALDRAVRADTLVLGPAAFRHSLSREYDRPTRIEILLDNAATPLVVERPAEQAVEPWRIPFPRPQRVERILVRILNREPGAGAPGLVGFSEVSLELSER